MERSDYWRVYSKKWDKENRGWIPSNSDENPGAFADTAPVYYSGRFIRLENYLAVPTFMRLGHRLEV